MKNEFLRDFGKELEIGGEKHEWMSAIGMLNDVLESPET